MYGELKRRRQSRGLFQRAIPSEEAEEVNERKAV
jgi:hypothetical protein